MNSIVLERSKADRARQAPDLPDPALSGGSTDSQLAALHACLHRFARLRTTRTTQHEHRNYASRQGGQGAQLKRAYLGCMGVRECAGWRAVHARKAGQCLTWAQKAPPWRCRPGKWSLRTVTATCQRSAHAVSNT